MIEILDKKSCTGCEACVQVCSRQCIEFMLDTEGFFYPKVNKNLCIDCGLCDAVCPVINQMQLPTDFKVFGAKNRNSQIVKDSSSGGIFTLLSEKIFEQKGVVFGAKFDENWQVVHTKIDKIEDINRLQGAKYVQSRIGTTFQEVREELKNGKSVLFSGTPCQTAGLRLFLRKEYENLILVDFICHGTPSLSIWESYLSEITDKYSITRVDNIKFRDKRKGWKNYHFSISGVDENNKKIDLHRYFKDVSYMQGFLSNLYLRPSCYDCPAKGGRSGSDITIADFWGLKKILPTFNDNKGVSLVVLNSSKGVDFFESIPKTQLEKRLTTTKAIQQTFYNSALENKNREIFFKEYSENKSGLIALIYIYSKRSRYKKIKNLILGEF
ncbi:MAG: Coenzyme F420 hydrogenase/dehydrogenase, beta subunit C-terminal domain [Rikenellaceae bacterium]